MQTEFSRVLALLRKEKGISQKVAASDLGVSQALLSHYEKGVRECGLEFVVKVADYYNVSCDYLLGRSAERSGVILGSEDLPEPEASDRAVNVRGNLLPTLNKKLIANSINVIFGMLSRVGNKELTVHASNYLNLSVYTVYRYLYSLNPKNPQDAFNIDKAQWTGLTEATQTMDKMHVRCITENIGAKMTAADKEFMAISPEKLYREYPLFASSLVNLIKNTEENVRELTDKKGK